MPTPSSPLIGLVPLLAAAALLAVSIGAHRRGRPVPVGRVTLAWVCVFVVLLALMGVSSLGGLFGADLGTMVTYALVTGAFGCVALLRERLASLLEKALGRTRLPLWAREAVVAAVVLVAATALATLALERPWNASCLHISAPYSLLEGGIVALVLLALYLVSQGTGVGPAVGVGALWAIGVSQYYVMEFKTTAILPSDVLALSTAFSVSGSYSYVFPAQVVWALLLAEGAVCLLSLLQPPRRRRRARSVVGHLAGAGVAVAACALLVVVPDYARDFQVDISYWWPLDSYSAQGFLPTFVRVAQDLPVKVPDGYDEQSARQLEEEAATAYDDAQAQQGDPYAAAREQFANERPSVIAVMNESFSDLSVYDRLDIGYDGPTYLRQGLGDALLKGDLSVSVVGGGTCNTEFEFLTGDSLAFVGDGKYPYTVYDLSQATSLARQLRDLGYHTCAIHPNTATNWNRARVYPALGFDEFLDIDDFEGAEEFHSGVSDEETYDRILEMLRSSDDPQFVFDVTMQNHSGYDQDNIPEELLGGYEASLLDDEGNAELNEYLACIEESDRALEAFVDELRTLDRPVVLVFFGDHQPKFAPTIDDLYYADETDEMAHAQRTRQTCYAVWANYDVAGVDQTSEETFLGVDDLAAVTLERMGAPLTTYQKARLEAQTSLRAINTAGYLGADGTWYQPDADGPYAETFRELAQVEYLEFGSKT